MRAPVLLLLVLAAAGGLVFLLQQAGEGPGGDTWVDEPDAPTDGAPTPEELRGVERAPSVAVWGQDGGTPLPPLDHAAAMHVLLRFDTDTDAVTGAQWLQAVRTQGGDRLPLRFTSQASLERFEQAVLLSEAPPAEIDVPATLSWVRGAGWVVEEQAGFLLIRAERKP